MGASGPVAGSAGEVPEPILHADMDAFYASVEQRDDPSLAGRPVVVGGGGDRGVVAAASYEARRFGIRSAMPMARARRACNDLVVVSPRFDRYRDVSRQVMAIFTDVTPLVEALSLDEAFLDVGGAARLLGPPPVIAARIRADVRAQTDLPCSIGIGPSKFVAKLLSGKAKPDGLAHWRVDEVTASLAPLPVSDLWGAGPKTVERLRAYGFTTIGQVADADPDALARLLGGALGTQLHRLARGIDDRAVTPGEAAKSVSAEETFETDLDDPDAMARVLLRQAETVGRRLRAADRAGRTVTIKVRFASFQTVTRSVTLDQPTDSTHEIAASAQGLLDALGVDRPRVRLLGVGVSNLADEHSARQLSLDIPVDNAGTGTPDDRDARWQALERTTDDVTDRFGDAGVSFAATLRPDPDDPAPNRDDL